MSNKKLLPHHEKMLTEGSAISKDIVIRRGYFSITSQAEAEALGFSSKQARVVSEQYPALIIPYYGPDGSNGVYCMRPDNPRSMDDKKKKKLADGTYPQKVFKYEMPKGAGNVLDCHPVIIDDLSNPEKPVFFTEGAKKADALISRGFTAININGVYGWRGTNAKQGKTALSDFESVALSRRKVVLLFDSDVVSNDNVKAALRRFKSFLETRGASVTPVLLPAMNNKTGIDDWFAAGHTADELNQLVVYFDIFSPDLGKQTQDWTTEAFFRLFDEWGYHFAINDMDESIEINGELLNDTRLDIIEARMMDENIPIGHAKRAITVYGDTYRYHPIKDYLNGLKWDGKDWVGSLASYFVDKYDVFETFLKRWLIGAVAKIMSGGQHQNFMLVLGGPQNIGKSYFAHWVCPLDKYFLESPLNPDDKDTLIRLMSNFIWEVGELGSVTRRADREALKRIVTMQTVTVRKSFGRFDTVKPAIASFIGTVNPEAGGFLNDPTGNRRYAVVILRSIDFAYAQDIDINQVWAQAVSLYKTGEDWQLIGSEAETRDRINIEYETLEPLEDMIFDKFELDPSQADTEGWRMTGPQILGYLGLKVEDRALTMRLASVLKRAGLEKTNPMADGKRYWLGIQTK